MCREGHAIHAVATHPDSERGSCRIYLADQYHAYPMERSTEDSRMMPQNQERSPS